MPFSATNNSTTTTGSPFTIQWTNATSSATITSPTMTWRYDDPPSAVIIQDRIPDKLPAGKRTLELPDGAKLHVDDAGNYRIEDKDAKVTYRANRNRDFSPHLNASDMLAAFVRHVGALGLKQKEVLGLPIELFISWLVIEAAERDQDPIPEDVKRIEHHSAIATVLRPKCLQCGRFIPRLNHEVRFPFCRPEHGAQYIGRNRT
jgi:hypothetical protein